MRAIDRRLTVRAVPDDDVADALADEDVPRPRRASMTVDMIQFNSSRAHSRDAPETTPTGSRERRRARGNLSASSHPPFARDGGRTRDRRLDARAELSRHCDARASSNVANRDRVARSSPAIDARGTMTTTVARARALGDDATATGRPSRAKSATAQIVRAFAFALALVSARVGGARAVNYDPCVPSAERDVERGGGIAVGIAYWAGATAEAWDGLHPCADAATLAAKGVGTTTFLMNSNEMSALRGTRADEDGLYASNSSAKIMTVVAYTATKATTPRVARIEASEPSNASGRSGRVSGLTMLVTLEEGNVKYLRWHDRGCGECGGAASERCVDVGEGQRACAASMEGCDGTCTGTTCDVELGTVDALRCQLTVAVVTSGTDKNVETFPLGSQLERLSMYSGSGAYSSAAARTTATVTGVQNWITG